MKKINHTTVVVFLIVISFTTRAQEPAYFSNITTEDGLSSNNIRSLAIDKNGFLWIGTVEGLNVYDGYSVTTCLKKDQPELASNNIIHLTVDAHNNKWLGTFEGVTLVDANRKFQRIKLDTFLRFGCRTIIETKAFGIVLYTSLGQYYFDTAHKKWQKLEWI